MGSLSRKPHGFIILSLVMKAQNQNLSNTLVKHGIKELRYRSLVPSLTNRKSSKIIFRIWMYFLLLDNYGDRRKFYIPGTHSSSYLSRPGLTKPVGSRRLLTREPAEHPTPNLGFRSFRFKSYSVHIHLLY